MAHILGRYGYAREQAYFKTEQEADIQILRRKLLKERKRVDGREMTEEELQELEEAVKLESEKTFEVGMEILQQQARITDEKAASRKEFDMRVKGAPMDLTPEERLKYGMRIGSIESYTPTVPKVRFGRDRLDPMFREASHGNQLAHTSLSPEAQELARRTYMTGVRSLVYGSLIGAVGTTFAVGYTLHACEIHSKEDMKLLLEGWSTPFAERIRARMHGVDERFRSRLSAMGLRPSEGSDGQSEFSQRLSSKLLRAGANVKLSDEKQA